MENRLEEQKQENQSADSASETKTSKGKSSDADDSLDFTGDDVKPENEIQKPLEYDPRPIEDGARRNIAYALIAILGFLIIAIIELLWSKKINLTDLKEFAVILGPIITLVSAATGFYYGTK